MKIANFPVPKMPEGSNKSAEMIIPNSNVKITYIDSDEDGQVDCQINSVLGENDTWIKKEEHNWGENGYHSYKHYNNDGSYTHKIDTNGNETVEHAYEYDKDGKLVQEFHDRNQNGKNDSFLVTAWYDIFK